MKPAMTDTEKAEQKAFMRDFMETTGLSISRVAEILGRKVATAEKYLWADNPLAPAHREKLQKAKPHYSNGHYVLESSDTPDEPQRLPAGFPIYRAGNSPRAKLRQAREAAGMSIPELAKTVHRDVSYLRGLEEGLTPISENSAELLADALSIPKAVLLEGSDAPRIIDETGMRGTYGAKPEIQLPPGMKGRLVPLLSNAQAGAWDAGHTDGLYDYTSVFVADVDDRRAFGISVTGNSMEPDLRQGDIVICSPSLEAPDGDAVVVRTRSEQSFIKYLKRGKNAVELISSNPAYDPIKFPLEEIAGIWPIVQVIRKGKLSRKL